MAVSIATPEKFLSSWDIIVGMFLRAVEDLEAFSTNAQNENDKLISVYRATILLEGSKYAHEKIANSSVFIESKWYPFKYNQEVTVRRYSWFEKVKSLGWGSTQHIKTVDDYFNRFRPTRAKLLKVYYRAFDVFILDAGIVYEGMNRVSSENLMNSIMNTTSVSRFEEILNTIDDSRDHDEPINYSEENRVWLRRNKLIE